MADKPDPPNKKTKPGDQRGARRGMTTTPSNGGSIGQAPYVASDRDREFVRKHVFYLGLERTAQRLGISSKTVSRHFPDEIAAADEEYLAGLGMTAMQRALKGDGPMLRFVLATRFPELWSPKYRLQHEGKIGVERALDNGQLLEGKSKDECAALLAAIDTLVAAGGIDLPAGTDGSAPAGSGEDSGTPP